MALEVPADPNTGASPINPQLQESLAEWFVPFRSEWSALRRKDTDMLLASAEPIVAEITAALATIPADRPACTAAVGPAEKDSTVVKASVDELRAVVRLLVTPGAVQSTHVRSLPASVLAAPRDEALRGFANCLDAVLKPLEQQREQQRPAEFSLDEDLAHLAALEGPDGEAARRVAKHVQQLLAELQQASREHSATCRELARRTHLVRGRREQYAEQRAVQQRRRAAAAAAAGSLGTGAAPAAAATAGPAAFWSGLQASGEPEGQMSRCNGVTMAPSAGPAAGGSAGSDAGTDTTAAGGYPRAHRPRHGDGEGSPASVYVATGAAEACSPAAISHGTRWRCSICGLLVDDYSRAQRHCATAHGTQPCEPVEVQAAPSSAQAAKAPPAFGPTLFGAEWCPKPAPSVVPPVVPIFNATRCLASGTGSALSPTQNTADALPGAASGAQGPDSGGACSLEERVQQLRLGSPCSPGGGESGARVESDSEL
mmetsp:Transcript_5201/g.15312  ORF Transcript_5201/g.15312 Transcript_5201/m.15312 type:complete len:486 (-) Transcript_5201:50-1507(-)